MSLTIIIFAGLSSVILFLFYYIAMRDKLINRKFSLIEKSLENINRDIYKLASSNDEKTKLLIAEELDKSMQILINSIKESRKETEKEIRFLVEKVDVLENNFKAISSPKMRPSSNMDASKILELHELGYNEEEIAKELGIPIGNIKFHLNIKRK